MGYKNLSLLATSLSLVLILSKEFEVKIHSKVVEDHSSLIKILYATSVILKLLHLSVVLYTAHTTVAFVLKSSQNGYLSNF